MCAKTEKRKEKGVKKLQTRRDRLKIFTEKQLHEECKHFKQTHHHEEKKSDSKQNEMILLKKQSTKGEKPIIVRDATTGEERWAGRAQNRS